MDETLSSDAGKTLDIDAIKDMIPHRHPFLLIDEVTDLTPDVEATGIKNVNADEPYFEGHFPGYPIMPGVLIVEAMAQTSAVLVVSTMGKQPGSVVYFMSVDQARFRKPVFPGDQLHLHVVKQRQRGKVWKFQGEARVGEDIVAEATFTAMIVDPK